MAATCTVTGTAGPGNTVAAVVVQNVTSVVFDCVNNMLTLYVSDGTIRSISIAAAATITATKSGSTYTFTIAN